MPSPIIRAAICSRVSRYFFWRRVASTRAYWPSRKPLGCSTLMSPYQQGLIVFVVAEQPTGASMQRNLAMPCSGWNGLTV